MVQRVIGQRLQEGHDRGLFFNSEAEISEFGFVNGLGHLGRRPTRDTEAWVGGIGHLPKRVARVVEVDDLLKRREEVAMPGGRGQFDVAER